MPSLWWGDIAGQCWLVVLEDRQTHGDILCVVNVCVFKPPFVYRVNGTVELDSHCMELANGIYRVEFRRVEKVIRASCQAVAFSEASTHRSQVSASPDITAGQ